MWLQKVIRLNPRKRGFHLVTDELLRALPEIGQFQCGLLHLFIRHTSASLVINENADPTVRRDLEVHLRQLIPDGAAHYLHTAEGGDDMPGHIKACLIGSSVSIPVGDGRLLLGTWQGIYLGEHREQAGARTLVATINGETG